MGSLYLYRTQHGTRKALTGGHTGHFGLVLMGLLFNFQFRSVFVMLP